MTVEPGRESLLGRSVKVESGFAQRKQAGRLRNVIVACLKLLFSA